LGVPAVLVLAGLPEVSLGVSGCCCRPVGGGELAEVAGAAEAGGCFLGAGGAKGAEGRADLAGDLADLLLEVPQVEGAGKRLGADRAEEL
jgi:hypothetical protein